MVHLALAKPDEGPTAVNNGYVTTLWNLEDFEREYNLVLAATVCGHLGKGAEGEVVE